MKQLIWPVAMSLFLAMPGLAWGIDFGYVGNVDLDPLKSVALDAVEVQLQPAQGIRMTARAGYQFIYLSGRRSAFRKVWGSLFSASTYTVGFNYKLLGGMPAIAGLLMEVCRDGYGTVCGGDKPTSQYKVTEPYDRNVRPTNLALSATNQSIVRTKNSSTVTGRMIGFVALKNTLTGVYRSRSFDEGGFTAKRVYVPSIGVVLESMTYSPPVTIQ